MDTTERLDFDQMVKILHHFLLHNNDGQRLWDVLTALRGPDHPSETHQMGPMEASIAYSLRRKRKRFTTEVIRGLTFPGVGAARYRTDVKEVYLPTYNEWDHFDKHISKAAHSLGLTVKTGEEYACRLPKKVKKPKAVQIGSQIDTFEVLESFLAPEDQVDQNSPDT